MTAATLILTVALLLAAAIITACIDRWSHARRQTRDRLPDTGDACREIDVLKRGVICPWPRAE